MMLYVQLILYDGNFFLHKKEYIIIFTYTVHYTVYPIHLSQSINSPPSSLSLSLFVSIRYIIRTVGCTSTGRIMCSLGCRPCYRLLQ